MHLTWVSIKLKLLHNYSLTDTPTQNVGQGFPVRLHRSRGAQWQPSAIAGGLWWAAQLFPDPGWTSEGKFACTCLVLMSQPNSLLFCSKFNDLACCPPAQDDENLNMFQLLHGELMVVVSSDLFRQWAVMPTARWSTLWSNGCVVLLELWPKATLGMYARGFPHEFTVFSCSFVILLTIVRAQPWILFSEHRGAICQLDSSFGGLCFTFVFLISSSQRPEAEIRELMRRVMKTVPRSRTLVSIPAIFNPASWLARDRRYCAVSTWLTTSKSTPTLCRCGISAWFRRTPPVLTATALSSRIEVWMFNIGRGFSVLSPVYSCVSHSKIAEV